MNGLMNGKPEIEDGSTPDIFGRALIDYYQGRFQSPLKLHNTYGTPEEVPLDGYFFDEQNFSEMEDFTLSLCRGRVLDVGAAAGRHTLSLQTRGMEATGLEVSPACCTLMRARGVERVVQADIHKWNDGSFDTMIFLMNGIGLAKSVEGLKGLLEHLKELVVPSGQVIFDSSDVSYLYEGSKKPIKRYFGEIDYKYEYKGQTGNWFSWLYIDMDEMLKICQESGWMMQVIYEDETGTYLGRLSLI